MTFRKIKRLYLKDGNVTGLKFGEIVNHTIQAISCPQRRLGELSEYHEFKRPGVYFLFGIDEESGESKVYIGEAENVYAIIVGYSINGPKNWKNAYGKSIKELEREKVSLNN